MRLGIDAFLSDPPPNLLNKRWGLLSNQASVNRQGHYSKDLLWGKFENNLKCLFSPQHGFWGTEQDNMMETPDSRDAATGLPLYSLYSATRRPLPWMMEAMDVLLIDLQDIGTRVYTFITTLAYCLQECRKQGKTVLVLDRPNPIGGLALEGNILQSSLFSFVGVYALPMRHGLTIGEIANLLNREMQIEADLKVIPMQAWGRATLLDQTGVPWMMPSPNMPGMTTALVYPGQVLWEGTNISEGRGTTRPFEFFGAPFINPVDVKKSLKDHDLPGVHLIDVAFRPTFQKWRGRECRGFFLRVYDPTAFKPYYTSLTLIQIIRSLYPDEFKWKDPPYEYETKHLPIDLLIGDRSIRRNLEEGTSPEQLESSWQEGLSAFAQLRKKYLLYQ
jgi:uncharacterized protein YbbC (DUF1343 family)